jgi:RimJ/RimL family protein N-acetyltransferase
VGGGLEVITADTDPRNVASLAFWAGLGFEVTGREERTLQVGPYGVEDAEGGEWVDSVYLALRREVWMERSRAERGGQRDTDGA